MLYEKKSRLYVNKCKFRFPYRVLHLILEKSKSLKILISQLYSLKSCMLIIFLHSSDRYLIRFTMKLVIVHAAHFIIL